MARKPEAEPLAGEEPLVVCLASCSAVSVEALPLVGLEEERRGVSSATLGRERQAREARLQEVGPASDLVVIHIAA